MALTKIPANLLSGVDLGDSVRVNIGSDNDLALFHTGSNGVIHNTTGALRIRANTLNIQDYSNEEAMITANSNGSVNLYYDNSKKFETTSAGASVTGNLAVSGNLTVSGTTTEISTTNLQVEDKNIVLNYGSGDTSSNVDGAGITIQDAVDQDTDATLNWVAANDRFKFSHGLEIDSGDVGINMNPSGYGKLSVNSTGVILALRASSGAGKLGFYEGGAGRFYLETLNGTDGLKFVDGDGSSVRMLIDADGKVGIGTSSADAPLTISGGTAMTGGWGRTLTLAHNFPVLVFQGEYSTDAFAGIGYDNTTGMRFWVDSSTNDVVGNTNLAMTILDNKNVGIGDSNPQHPFKVNLSNGQIAMFGSNGQNSSGQYCGIGLGQVLANNTTYQKVSLVYEGRDNGNYVGNFRILVDVEANSESATLEDSKLLIDGANGYLAVGPYSLVPYSRAEFHLDQVAAAYNVNGGSAVHFGSQQHTNGAMMGITLGYREASMNYRKVGIFARGRGDNAARQDLLLCVDTVSDAGGCRDTDAKITINGTTGECKIGNTTVESETYALKVQTQHGYGRQGSANSSYFHHETDRAYNYWNEAGYFSGGAHTYSDESLKKDIVVIPDALASVAKMNGVTFKWKDPSTRGGKGTGTGKQFGVIAQNMLEVDAELPTLSDDPLSPEETRETDAKLYSMDYARLSPYFIEAIKELKEKLEAAEARIATLEG